MKLRPRPLDTSEEADRIQTEIYRAMSPERRLRLGFEAAEDVILSKLQWYKMSDSGRQIEDALAVAKLQKGKLDLMYLRKWAKSLGIEEC